MLRRNPLAAHLASLGRRNPRGMARKLGVVVGVEAVEALSRCVEAVVDWTSGWFKSRRGIAGSLVKCSGELS